jgi:hypothetical protein
MLLKCFCYSSGTCQVYVARRKIPLTVLDYVMFLIELLANMLNLLLEFESSIIFPILSSSEGGTFEELQLHSCRCLLVLWVCPPSRSWWIMGVSWAITCTTGKECCWEFWCWRVGTMPWHKVSWSLILDFGSTLSLQVHIWGGIPLGISNWNCWYKAVAQDSLKFSPYFSCAILIHSWSSMIWVAKHLKSAESSLSCHMWPGCCWMLILVVCMVVHWKIRNQSELRTVIAIVWC